ncbi:SMI1/KNR4 family protein [Pelosinus sp. IPA-1]|uniref:SMI1/KNR4 family protein n=1 Tax=Pelosinus sp. IPA-1 TaxID=3029569 RepID=UPI0024361C84|nr:SMI1/KNR4 family protein [Pelosinus sp. IPA-1]GMA98768.1 SMI1/KNR4 family protein [Pelosinus sp. IPA-1]
MADFSFLKEYVFDLKDDKRLTSKHAFHELSNDEVEDAEKSINRRFPKELKEFYQQIGYGFLCKQDKKLNDRIMDPGSIADFILREDRFEYDEYRDMIDIEKEMVFFEVAESSYLSLDLTQEDENGVCPVLCFGNKIADSILDFVKKMDAETDYFINL